MSSYITLSIARGQIAELRLQAERSRVRRQFRQARRAARAAERPVRAAGRRTDTAKPSNVALRGPGRINIA